MSSLEKDFSHLEKDLSSLEKDLSDFVNDFSASAPAGIAATQSRVKRINMLMIIYFILSPESANDPWWYMDHMHM